MEDPRKEKPVTLCIYLYKAKIRSDGSFVKLRLIIVVIGDLKNKEFIGDTWFPTASMRTLKDFFAGYSNNKSRVHQLDFIGSFVQGNVKYLVL